MAKTKQRKQSDIALLEDRLAKIKAVVFTNFDGLNVKDTSELRKILREQKIDYLVVKKTLLKIALKEAKLDFDPDKMAGSLGMAFGYEDEILPAKTLDVFAKTHPALKLVGGISDGQFIDAQAVQQLAKLPSKEELLSKVVWLFNYPMSGLVNVMAGNIKSLLYALQAIKDKKPA